MGGMSVTLTPARPASAAARPSRPWAKWFAPAAPRAITAVMLGSSCHAVRVQPNAAGGVEMTAAVEGTPADLKAWASLFAGSQPLLVLRSEERHLLTIDKPEVPDAELALAVRWPLGEALDTEAEQLLTTALPLPRINDSLRPQVLRARAERHPGAAGRQG